MKTEVTTFVEVAEQTVRGSRIKVKGSKGMFTFSLGDKEFVFYTNELDQVITLLTTFRDELRKNNLL